MSDFGENSLVGSKIVRFLWKWMALAEISTKVILLLKKKESSVPLLAVQIHFMVPMVCLRACTSSSFRMIRTEDADGAISSNVSMGKVPFS